MICEFQTSTLLVVGTKRFSTFKLEQIKLSNMNYFFHVTAVLSVIFSMWWMLGSDTRVSINDQLWLINNSAFSTVIQEYVTEQPTHVLFSWGQQSMGKTTAIQRNCERLESKVMYLKINIY